jgi:hypothetical protein
MATYVETEDVRLFIDPGVALGPSRYGLPPHPSERKRRADHWAEVVRWGCKAEVLVVTHYHYDHHSPWEGTDLYEGKVVLLKHPTVKINRSQRKRASYFLEQIEGKAERVEPCDGKDYTFGGTRVRFSKPVCHGTDPRLGYVVGVLVEEGEERFLFTSDVEGPSRREQQAFILESRPTLLYVDGPMTYLLGYRYSTASLEKSIRALLRIVRECPLEALLLDHHLLRDLAWETRVRKVIDAAGEEGVKVETAAGFSGRPLDLLEARRKELYGKDPPGDGESGR